MHGHAIARHIQRVSEDVLTVKEGSLYPALHRLERKGLVQASWKASENNRRARYYRLTPSARRHLKAEEVSWARFTGAVARVLGGGKA
jgi:transcriptional regulator